MTLTITLKTSSGAVVAGQVVTLEATGTGNILVQPDAPTSEAGVATATITSTVAEAKTVTVRAGTVVLAAVPTITFVDAPAISATTSTLTATPINVLADGTATSSLQATVRDADGAPIAGATVLFAASGSERLLVQPASVTDADGVATGTVASTKAGDALVSVTAAGVALDAKATVTFTPGAVDATLSTVTVSPSAGVVADGTSTATVTIALRDAHGNPVPDATALLSSSGSGNVLTQPAATDQTGAATASIASTVAETKTLTVTAGTLALSAQPSVAFRAGSAAATRSTVVVSPSTLVADGVATATFTVTVRDANGNPVEGSAVTLATSSQAAIFGQPAATDGSGVTTGTIATTRAATYEVAVTADGVTLGNPTVTFLPGPVDASHSTLVATPGSGVTADGVTISVLAVLARDLNDNTISGATVVLGATGTGNVLTQPSATDAQGAALGTLASTVAEGKTVTATVDGVLLATPAVVGFVPGPVSATLSTATASPTTDLVADGVTSSTVTITARDGQGNPISGADVSIAATNFASTTTPANTDSAGVTTAMVTALSATEKVLTITIAGTVLASQPTITFIPGPVDASHSTLVATPGSGVTADGVTSTVLAVLARDLNDNTISGATVVLGATGTGNVLTQPSATDAQGAALGTLASTVAEGKTVTATVDGVLLTTPAVVGFVPGPVSATLSTATASPSTDVVADGVASSTVTITARDGHGNPISGADVSIAATNFASTTTPANTDSAGVTTAMVTALSATEKVLTITIAGTVLASQPTIAFIPGPVSKSFRRANPTAVIANGIDETTLLIIAEDVMGNGVPGATVVLSASGTGNTLSTPPLTDASGLTTAKFRSTVAELKTVSVTANGVAVGSVDVQFLPGPIDAAMSSVSVLPAQGVVADGAASATVTVTLADAHGNTIPGASVQLAASGAGATFTQPGVTGTNGVTTGEVRSTVAEAKTLTATADGITLANRPTVSFRPGPASALSTVSASPTSVIANGVASSTVTVTARDAHNNVVPGATVLLSMSGSNNTLVQPTAPTDASGVTTGTIRSTEAAVKTVSATVDGVSTTQPGTVTFVAGPPHGSLSTVVASPNTILADGEAFSTLTITLRDVHGNLVPNAPVNLATDGLLMSLAQPSPTSTSGVTTGRVSSRRSGQTVTVTITATSGVTFTTTLATTGLFELPVVTPIPGTGARALVVRDFDGDSHADIAVSNTTSNTVAMLFGQGDGTFRSDTLTLTTPTNPIKLAVADFNRDSLPDLASLNKGSNSASIFRNTTTTGVPSMAAGVSYSTAATPIAFSAGDLNGDLQADLALADSGRFSSRLNSGAPDYNHGQHLTMNTGYAEFGDMTTADFDGDGILDVVLGFASNYIYVNKGDGGGGLQFGSFGSVNCVSGALAALIATDLNADLRPDVLSLSQGDRMCAFLNTGTGVVAYTGNWATGQSPVAVATGDFDGDGFVDVVTTNEIGGDMTVLRSNGAGGYSMPISTLVGPSPHGVVAHDFNGDGKLDVAAVSTTNQTVSVFLRP